MNTIHTTTIAFADPKLPPQPDDVRAVIGDAAYGEVAKLNAWIDATHHNVVREWKFSQQCGWYEIPMLKARRLFYFIPKSGDFRLNLILGEKALAAALDGPHRRQIEALLKTAKRYPEGIVFEFNRRSLQADLLEAMLRAKLAH